MAFHNFNMRNDWARQLNFLRNLSTFVVKSTVNFSLQFGTFRSHCFEKSIDIYGISITAMPLDKLLERLTCNVLILFIIFNSSLKCHTFEKVKYFFLFSSDNKQLLSGVTVNSRWLCGLGQCQHLAHALPGGGQMAPGVARVRHLDILRLRLVHHFHLPRVHHQYRQVFQYFKPRIQKVRL